MFTRVIQDQRCKNKKTKQGLSVSLYKIVKFAQWLYFYYDRTIILFKSRLRDSEYNDRQMVWNVDYVGESNVPAINFTLFW